MAMSDVLSTLIDLKYKKAAIDKMNREGGRPLSETIRGTTEPEFREDFEIPFGPMKRGEATALDLVGSERTGIPASMMGLTPSQYKDVTAGNENLRPKTNPEDKSAEWDRRFKMQQDEFDRRFEKGSERMEGLQQNRFDEAAARRQQFLINQFNSDPSVKKAQQSIDSASMIEDLAISGNPIAAAAIPTFMARASGEVGALSEADKAPFGGSRAILQRFNATLKQAVNGQLTEDNKAFILQLTNLMKARASQNKQATAKLRSKQYSRIKGLGNEQEIYSILNPVEETIGVNNPDGLTPEETAEMEQLKRELGEQ